MDTEIVELRNTIETLTKANADLLAWKQEYNGHKQSLDRMSTRLRKLCKRLTASPEMVAEMQKLADDIRALVKEITA